MESNVYPNTYRKAYGVKDNAVYISATTGYGLPDLIKALDYAIINVTGRVTKRIKVPQNGPHLR